MMTRYEEHWMALLDGMGYLLHFERLDLYIAVGLDDSGIFARCIHD
jgi:hypothetical protein